jgi:UDP-N-acetylmuramate dehydrogenase
MVLNPVDHDTWSVGSFFTNPILSRQTKLPDNCPSWEQEDGRVKISAAWLVEHSGHAKGFGINKNATLSNKHTLAITNRGSSTASDVLELANHIQEKVHAQFGIKLEIEPNLIGIF